MLKFTINKLGAGSQGIEPLRAVPLFFFTNDVGEAVKWNDSRESFELKERASICFRVVRKLCKWMLLTVIIYAFIYEYFLY